MISKKSKAIIFLGAVMLSTSTISYSLLQNTASYKETLSTNLSNVKEVYTASNSNTVLENAFDNTVNNDDIVLEEVSSDAMNNNIVLQDTSNSTINNNVVLEDTSNSAINNESIVEDTSDNTINNDAALEDTSENTINDDVVLEDTSNSDVNIAQNTIACPPLNEAPVFNVSDGFNENGIGDSVYEHLKSIGWTSLDSNTISVNNNRLQFKNMNGLNNIDSIITIRCDFEENDKYALYLLKLMIGDKSISTADPTDSEIFSGAFNDTYYDNFENLVRRIANGSGTIKYSNRSIRVQYDGNWDYTITLTFSNYNDNSNDSAPSISEENNNIIYDEAPEA